MSRTKKIPGIKNPVILGGIIKHHKGYGFKISFDNTCDAQKYKDMLMFIFKDDNIPYICNMGYYDNKEWYK